MEGAGRSPDNLGRFRTAASAGGANERSREELFEQFKATSDLLQQVGAALDPTSLESRINYALYQHAVCHARRTFSERSKH